MLDFIFGPKWKAGFMIGISRVAAVEWSLGPRRIEGLVYGARHTVSPDWGPSRSEDFVHALRFDGKGRLQERWRVDVQPEGIHRHAFARAGNAVVLGQPDGALVSVDLESGAISPLARGDRLAKPIVVEGDTLVARFADGSQHDMPLSPAAAHILDPGERRPATAVRGEYREVWRWPLADGRSIVWCEQRFPDLANIAVAIDGPQAPSPLIPLGLGRSTEPDPPHLIDDLLVVTADVGRDSDLDPVEATVLVDILGHRVCGIIDRGKKSILHDESGKKRWSGHL